MIIMVYSSNWFDVWKDNARDMQHICIFKGYKFLSSFDIYLKISRKIYNSFLSIELKIKQFDKHSVQINISKVKKTN